MSGMKGDDATIPSAYWMLGPLIGPTAAILFVASLTPCRRKCGATSAMLPSDFCGIV